MAVAVTPAVREERYRKILQALVAEDRFVLADAKRACADLRPALVTRVVRQLEAEGYLEQVEDGPRGEYRWLQRGKTFEADGWIDRRLARTQLSQTPASDRPRERLLAGGAASLRTAELIAILIRSGRPGESALQGGEKVANRYADSLDRLPQAGPATLEGISPAAGKTAYCQIMAGIELGRRVASATGDDAKQRIHSVDDAIAFCRDRFARLATDAAREEFHVVTLNTKHAILATHQVSVGILDASLVHPREVFFPAIQDAAAAVLLVHNHPSGDPTPSHQDLEITERLDEAGVTLQIDVLDHLIVAKGGVTSIRQWRQDRGPERGAG